MVTYALLGKKGSGKDTFAKLIIENNNSFELLHFADKLKDVCSFTFSLEPKYFIDRELKEAKLPYELNIDDYVDALMYKLNIKLPKLGLVAKSPRDLLQMVGTNYVKNSYPNYWIDDTIEKIKNNAVIADTRFRDECESVTEAGGKIIKIFVLDRKSSDEHESEKAVDNIHANLDLGLYFGHMQIANIVAKHLAENDFHNALKYDYNRVQMFLESYKRLTYIKYGHNQAVSKATEMILEGDAETAKIIMNYYHPT